MAIDDVDGPDAEDIEAAVGTDDDSAPPARVGEYTWKAFMTEFGYESEIPRAYQSVEESSDGWFRSGSGATVPSDGDWEAVEFDPAGYLGFSPGVISEKIEAGAGLSKGLWEFFTTWVEATPVVKGKYGWEHYKWGTYYDSEGNPPRDGNGDVIPFDRDAHLGFPDEDIERVVSHAKGIGSVLYDVVDERTVNVNSELDEDEFFSSPDGYTTVVDRYDLEKAIPFAKKLHFEEINRYWVNKPFAFAIIFHSVKENEKKYYIVEPYLNEIEEQLVGYLSGKLKTTIKYSDDERVVNAREEERGAVIERETRRLLDRYDLYANPTGIGTEASGSEGILNRFKRLLGNEEFATQPVRDESHQLDGMSVRPEPIVVEEDNDQLSEYQVEKALYRLRRDFIGYGVIDGIKHDINVEDISVDGYNSPVFVYHSEFEQIITNLSHGKEDLDDFVVKLAQRSGKGISKRRPQVDATLPDGSRAQLTLGKEVSDHGTNYTIRQFKDVPFTPIDLINWNTFNLDEMAFLWLCIENDKSLIFAGGTASGKTTSLNAVSLFIPSSSKIVSIEDTREVELPQRNWVASVTRPSFGDDDKGNVDEFALLEAALRQRPEYIVMGEIRGEEGRTLFQVMSTGHTTYTTFHADSVGEVLKRFTTAPINVSKTLFTALDLVSVQTSTRVKGRKVRRNKTLTEINHYDPENDEINVQDVYQWQAETDEYLKLEMSNTLEDIKFDRGWNQEELESEIEKRRVVLAYLIKNRFNEYTKVAATVQAFINDQDTILTLMARGNLEAALDDLREMESVLIDVDPEKEALVPRPEPSSKIYDLCTDILTDAETNLFPKYRDMKIEGLAASLTDVSEGSTIVAGASDDDDGFDLEKAVDEAAVSDEPDFEWADEEPIESIDADEAGGFEFDDDTDTVAYDDDVEVGQFDDDTDAESRKDETDAETVKDETDAFAFDDEFSPVSDEEVSVLEDEEDNDE